MTNDPPDINRNALTLPAGKQESALRGLRFLAPGRKNRKI